MKELVRFLGKADKTIMNTTKGVGPLLFAASVIVLLLVVFIYFRGIKAYLREREKIMSAKDLDRLDDLAFISSRMDDEEKEFKALRAKKKELDKEGVLSYYISGAVLLLVAILALVKINLVIFWLRQF